MPIQLVPEGTPGASVVAVKRVNELDYYSLGAKQFAEKVGLTENKLVAVVDHLKIRDDYDCYKEFKIGSVLHKRYSAQTIKLVSEASRRLSRTRFTRRATKGRRSQHDGQAVSRQTRKG